MSAGVGVWKENLASAAAAQIRPNVDKAVTPIGLDADQDPVYSLVRQLFLSKAHNQLRRLLLVSAGCESSVGPLCERIGRVLSQVSGKSVGVMHASSTLVAERSKNNSPDSGPDSNLPFCKGTQIAEGLWRIPASFFSEVRWNAEQIKTKLPFPYVLFSSTVSDGLTPLFCYASDAAILVLTANKTRRECAARALEVLRQCRAEVLGTILENRKFPIPESIYRRL